MKIKTKFVLVLILSVFLSTATQLSAQTRISFRSGSNSALVSGKLPADMSKIYVLSAGQGQKLSATISSTNRKIQFFICDVGFYEGLMGSSYSFTTTAGNNQLCIYNPGKSASTFILKVSVR
jgi:hypothetical protein